MHRNNALLVKKIDTLVGKYNLLAAERGMQKIPYPSYGKALNDVSRRFLIRDLKTIGKAVKKIEEIPAGDKMKTAKGVEFTAGIISELPDFAAWKDEEGLWYYIKDIDDNICVYADTGKFIEKMNGGTELTLDYNDMPYEVLVDTDGNEWKVNSYTVYTSTDEDVMYLGLFGVRDTDNDWNINVAEKLTSLTLQGWTNKNVMYMTFMFSGCSALLSLNLSSFNTALVKGMGYMFYECSALTELDVSSFNTESVMYMGRMFHGCSALTELDVSSFNTDKVENMSFMFGGCFALKELDVSSFNTEKVKTMSNMFNRCSALTKLDVSRFNTDKVENMSFMFGGCFALKELDLSNFNTEKVNTMLGMFTRFSALTRLILGENFNIYPLESISLAPTKPCEITMNNASYTVLKDRELANYTFDPEDWTSSTPLQTFTVTPPPQSS